MLGIVQIQIRSMLPNLTHPRPHTSHQQSYLQSFLPTSQNAHLAHYHGPRQLPACVHSRHYLLFLSTLCSRTCSRRSVDTNPTNPTGVHPTPIVHLTTPSPLFLSFLRSSSLLVSSHLIPSLTGHLAGLFSLVYLTFGRLGPSICSRSVLGGRAQLEDH